MFKGSNMNSLILNVLPDNRPITSLQIVDDYEKCPKGFAPIHRTYDQDADADLWRESGMFAKRSTRYLCLSKSEGLPLYVIETLKVITDKEQPPEGFSLLSRTADTDQKAWRKRQIAYKLSKRGSITQAVTDIILCSKLRSAPQGFVLAGEINGVVVCFKLGNCAHREPPIVPRSQTHESLNTDLQNAMHYMNISTKPFKPLPSKPAADDYENIQSDYKISPARKAPSLPARPNPTVVHHHTLSAYSEIDGVPFMMNPKLGKSSKTEDISPSVFDSATTSFTYNFHLERQVLCSTKTPTSKNPFFKKD